MMEMHVCNRGGSILRAFALGDEAEVIVGRDESCDVQIKAKTVSREHCSIEMSGEQLVLKDLDSTSGTYLEGNRVENVELRDGIEITVGPAVLKFYESGI